MRNLYILVLLGLLMMPVVRADNDTFVNASVNQSLNVSVNSSNFFDGFESNGFFDGLGDDFIVRPSSFNELCWLGPGENVKDCFVRFGSNLPIIGCEAGGAYCELGNLSARVGFRKENDNFIYSTESLVVAFTGANRDNQVSEGRIGFVNLGFSIPLPEFEVSGAKDDGLLAWFFDVRNSSIVGIRWYSALVVLVLLIRLLRRPD